MMMDQKTLPPGMNTAYSNPQIPRKMLVEKNEYLNPSPVDQPLTRPLALRTNSVCSAGLLVAIS